MFQIFSMICRGIFACLAMINIFSFFRGGSREWSKPYKNSEGRLVHHDRHGIEHYKR